MRIRTDITTKDELDKYLRELVAKRSIPHDLDLSPYAHLLTVLPDNLRVIGSLNLTDCALLTSLPNNLTVGYWLTLAGCTGLKADLHKYYSFAKYVYLQSKGLRKWHCEDGPAMADEGKPRYFWHGVEVPEFVIMAPETITLRHIREEYKPRVRSVLVERYGHARFLKDAGAPIIAEDKFGVLFNIPMMDNSSRTFHVLKATKSSPEPDGSFKDYYTLVPSVCRGNPLITDKAPLNTPYLAAWWTFTDLWENGIPYNPAIHDVGRE